MSWSIRRLLRKISRFRRPSPGDVEIGDPAPPAAAVKDVTFYDNFVPKLKAGQFTITARQSLTWKEGGPPSSPENPAVQSFLVHGPRFKLDPADIHRMFPPENGTGLYHEFLPMLVLNKRALPWERDLDLKNRQDVTKNRPNKFKGLTDAENYPWMALLTFTEDELPAPSGSTTPQENPTRIQTLLLNQIIEGETPGPPKGVLGPDLKSRLEADEDVDKIRCHAIDVPKETFTELMPSFYDAAFLAHARQITTEGTKAHDTATPQPPHPGWYSVVMGNRFTVPPTTAPKLRNIIHLVSLEGFEAYIGPGGMSLPAGVDKVRLVSLWSWTCTCLHDPHENFRQLMLHLISRQSEDGTDLLMRMPLLGRDTIDLETVGATNAIPAGKQTSIPLAAPSLVEVGQYVLLRLVDAKGNVLQQVTTSDKAAQGATAIPIVAAQIVKALPAGTRVLLEMPIADPIRHLRQLKALGTTWEGTAGTSQTSLPVVVPSTPPIAKDIVLEAVSPDGDDRQLVTVSKDATPGDKRIWIQPHTFSATLPQGSFVGLASDYLPIDRLSEGYTALSYAMRSGDDTFAWYRGPLASTVTKRFLETTQPTAPSNPAAPRTVSEAMIFDPVTGLFDQSYAVAFQTGRSLALGSKPFATNLLQWRREAHGLIDLLLEYMRSPALKKTFASLLDPDGNLNPTGIEDLRALLDPRLASKEFVDLLATELFQTIAKRVGKKGGFSAADQQDTVSGDVPPPPKPPPLPIKTALEKLMQQPAVIRLLQDMSGFQASVGQTAAALSGEQTQIPLAAKIAGRSIAQGAELLLVSPDSTQKVTVTTSAPAEEGDQTIAIEEHDFTPSLPAGSSVRLPPGIMPEQIVEWLAQTALLYNVPFDNLVPDERMLPVESIRFFYIDRNWIDALLDGALSIGIQSSRDSLLHQLLRDSLHRTVDDALLLVRDKLRPSAGAPQPLKTMAGFVIRSAVVSGWPGLELEAYSAADKTTPMKPLRLDRVSPNVMIGIYPDIPLSLGLSEPTEGLVFGIEDEGIHLRYVDGVDGATSENYGQETKPHEAAQVTPADVAKTQRSQPAGALNVGGDDGLIDTLECGFSGSRPTLGPAAFAVQMVKVPEQMLFTPKTGGNS